MRVRLWTALLTLPLLITALVYGRTFNRCHLVGASSLAASDSEEPECCQASGPDCCQQDKESIPTRRIENPDAQRNDPDKQIVFKVEGLHCPAVKGIGCGHMLRPVLVSLDKIDGVQASSANYTGTMIRISVTTAADRDQIAERVRKLLSEEDRKAVALSGDELGRALEKEQWRGAGQIGELTAIEFHTMALHRVKTFAKAEKLDTETADKLVKMAEEQWDRMIKEAQEAKATRPEDLANRCKECIPVFLERAKGILTGEQLEQFKKMLTTPCCDDDRPEAPPAPTKGAKARS